MQLLTISPPDLPGSNAPGGSAHCHLLLAHGAGTGKNSPFMAKVADLIADRGIGVSRFDFTYMAARAEAGKRKPPPKAETLAGEYEAAIAALQRELPRATHLLIGGKSMGGRVASLIADRLYAAKRISGLVCVGYPLHPPNKPDQLRTAHLQHLTCPALIVQGMRDPFGGAQEVASYALSPAIRFAWIGDGDHDLGPRGGSGFTRAGNLAAAADAIVAFASECGAR